VDILVAKQIKKVNIIVNVLAPLHNKYEIIHM